MAGDQEAWDALQGMNAWQEIPFIRQLSDGEWEFKPDYEFMPLIKPEELLAVMQKVRLPIYAWLSWGKNEAPIEVGGIVRQSRSLFWLVAYEGPIANPVRKIGRVILGPPQQLLSETLVEALSQFITTTVENYRITQRQEQLLRNQQ